MIRNFAFSAAATLSLALCVPPATAEVMSLRGYAVTIEPIPGYCAIDKARTEERKLFGFFEESLSADSQLLAFWVDCQALEAMRNGSQQGIGPYILVMASKKAGELFQTGLTRQQVVDQARMEIAGVYGRDEFPANLDGKAQEQIKSAIEQLPATANEAGKSGPSKFLGFMGRDDEGLYYAVAQKNSPAKSAPVLADVTGLTKVKRFVVSAIAYEPYAGAQTFFTLKDRAQAAVRALIDANPFDE